MSPEAQIEELPAMSNRIEKPVDPTDLFHRSLASIEGAYRDLGHTLGWRFLTGPASTLSVGTEIGFITLNPGGTSESADHPRASCEAGNAYMTETWPGSARGMAPLQRQVQMLFSEVIAKLGNRQTPSEFMNTQVMSAYFIPFRSPSIASLHRRVESLAFAGQLWSGIFQCWMPRCILTIDAESFRSIVRILGRRPNTSVSGSKSFPTGWGTIEAESLQIKGLRPDGPVTIARLPHLSRFQLFGSAIRAPHLDVFTNHLATSIDPRLTN